jgi:hypothetical protein
MNICCSLWDVASTHHLKVIQLKKIINGCLIFDNVLIVSCKTKVNWQFWVIGGEEGGEGGPNLLKFLVTIDTAFQLN